MRAIFTDRNGGRHLTEAEVSRREIEWYRNNGRHADRINQRHGREWLTGDWSWNRLYPRRRESVEDSMRWAGCYDLPKETPNRPTGDEG